MIADLPRPRQGGTRQKSHDSLDYRQTIETTSDGDAERQGIGNTLRCLDLQADRCTQQRLW